MPTWQQEILLVLTALGLQVLESRIRVGKAQSTIAWIVGALSVFLMAGAGVLAARGWSGALVHWIAGLGSWVHLILGIAGVVFLVLAVLAVLPQGISADVTNSTVLIGAFLFPALLPYAAAALAALIHVALPGASHGLSGMVGA